jgi:hypothetical protein
MAVNISIIWSGKDTSTQAPEHCGTVTLHELGSYVCAISLENEIREPPKCDATGRRCDEKQLPVQRHHPNYRQTNSNPYWPEEYAIWRHNRQGSA